MTYPKSYQQAKTQAAGTTESLDVGDCELSSAIHRWMCSHYQAMKDRERYRRHFGVEPPDDLGKFDVWPMYAASFIRRPLEADVGDEAVPVREALSGQFGLIPHWATDSTIARHTYNARSETVATKPSFRDAWKHGQRCIIRNSPANTVLAGI